MKTIEDVSHSFKQGLKTLYDERETGAITLTVLEELTGLSRAYIKAFPEKDIAGDIKNKLITVLNELKTGKPVQYILGTAAFYGSNFLVDPAVLIPRPETEELVEWALLSLRLMGDDQKTGKNEKTPVTVLDIGTGSGCIAISIKKNLPGAHVTALDISVKALQTARQNAVINNAAVDFIEMDMLEMKGIISGQGTNDPPLARQFSLMISNPPYVTLADKAHMHGNVVDFEPHTALFVPEEDPLIFYRAIAAFAIKHLKQNGLLFLEINENYGKQTMELLKNTGFYNIELRKDMSGKERMIMAGRL